MKVKGEDPEPRERGWMRIIGEFAPGVFGGSTFAKKDNKRKGGERSFNKLILEKEKRRQGNRGGSHDLGVP